MNASINELLTELREHLEEETRSAPTGKEILKAFQELAKEYERISTSKQAKQAEDRFKTKAGWVVSDPAWKKSDNAEVEDKALELIKKAFRSKLDFSSLTRRSSAKVSILQLSHLLQRQAKARLEKSVERIDDPKYPQKWVRNVKKMIASKDLWTATQIGEKLKNSLLHPVTFNPTRLSNKTLEATVAALRKALPKKYFIGVRYTKPSKFLVALSDGVIDLIG